MYSVKLFVYLYSCCIECCPLLSGGPMPAFAVGPTFLKSTSAWKTTKKTCGINGETFKLSNRLGNLAKNTQ